MATTIQISQDLKQELDKRKISNRETYEEVIWDLVEDTMELSEQTKKNIKESMEDVKAGRVYTMEEIKKRYKL
jgi:predicted transcriptional regulator